MSTEFTEDDHLLAKEPMLSTQLPVTFKSGFVFTEMNGTCAGCSCLMNADGVHARIIRREESMLEVQGLGKCPSCSIYTRFHYRVYDNQRFVLHINGGWKEYMMRASRWAQFKKRAQKVMRWLFTMPS